MKKGAVYKNSNITKLNPSWYYTWGLNGIDGVVDIPFIPMVWGKKNTNTSFTDTVLVLNEPDRPDQSNVSVDDAVFLWTSIKARRKGSPATAGNALNSPWFTSFMTQVSQKPDFICIHWYGPPHPSSLLGTIDSLYQKYSLPIWVTEFAVAQWDSTKPMYSLGDVKTFMSTILPELEKRPYVERYAWKTRDQSDPNMGTSALFDSQGNLTELGQLYASL